MTLPKIYYIQPPVIGITEMVSFLHLLYIDQLSNNTRGFRMKATKNARISRLKTISAMTVICLMLTACGKNPHLVKEEEPELVTSSSMTAPSIDPLEEFGIIGIEDGDDCIILIDDDDQRHQICNGEDGLQGIGDKGDTGDTGDTGDKGDKGIDAVFPYKVTKTASGISLTHLETGKKILLRHGTNGINGKDGKYPYTMRELEEGLLFTHIKDGSTFLLKHGKNGKDGKSIITPASAPIKSRYKIEVRGETLVIIDTENGTEHTFGKQGPAGKDGTNGTNAINGSDGSDGVDGVFPYTVVEQEDGVLLKHNSDETKNILIPKARDGVFPYSVEKNAKGTLLRHISGNAELNILLPDGINGIDGKDGKDGENGSNGIDGENGIDGIDGENGSNGIDGNDGEDGNDGLNVPCNPNKMVTVRTIPRKLTAQEKDALELPYKSNSKHQITILDLGQTQYNPAHKTAYVKNSQVLFGLDFEADLPPKNAINKILDLKIQMKAQKVSLEKNFRHTELICLLGDKICSGNKYDEANWVDNNNADFWSKNNLVSKEFANRIQNHLIFDGQYDVFKTDFLDLELATLFSKTEKEMVDMIYNYADSDQTLLWLVGDDLRIQDPQLIIRLRYDECKVRDQQLRP